jgi:hypothetical protein
MSRLGQNERHSFPRNSAISYTQFVVSEECWVVLLNHAKLTSSVNAISSTLWMEFKFATYCEPQISGNTCLGELENWKLKACVRAHARMRSIFVEFGVYMYIWFSIFWLTCGSLCNQSRGIHRRRPLARHVLWLLELLTRNFVPLGKSNSQSKFRSNLILGLATRVPKPKTSFSRPPHLRCSP